MKGRYLPKSTDNRFVVVGIQDGVRYTLSLDGEVLAFPSRHKAHEFARESGESSHVVLPLGSWLQRGAGGRTDGAS